MLPQRLLKLCKLLPRASNSGSSSLAPVVATRGIWSTSASNRPTQEEQDEFGLHPSSSEGSKCTYDDMKEVAKRSGGDPAKEWLEGAPATPTPVQQALKADKEQLYQSAKRGVEEATHHEALGGHRRGFTTAYLSNAPINKIFTNPPNFSSHPRISGRRYGSQTPPGEESSQSVGEKVKESMNQAADQLDRKMESAKEQIKSAATSVLGKGADEATRPGSQAINARAEWEASHSQEQQAAANASRKAQLTDEAYGDNPKEATPRMEKDTLQESLDTPH